MNKKRIYISGPISKGKLTNNIQQATNAFVSLAKSGFAPFCPHWSCFSGKVMDLGAGSVPYAYAMAIPNDLTHADWLGIDLAWVEVCDCILRLPGESVGADREVYHAIERGIPVFHTVVDAVNWLKAERNGRAAA